MDTPVDLAAAAAAAQIDAVLDLAADRLPAAAERAQLEAFAREYFRQADPEDVAARSAEDLLGSLLSHWQFASVREPGRPKIRALNPTVAENGWAARHTVLEIVNDDMPFLVDSVTMEINRQGLTLHLLVHPIFAVERNADGSVRSVKPRAPAGTASDAPHESWMHIEVDRLVDPQQRAQLASDVERVLGDVRAACTDWRPMLARLRAAIAELDLAKAPIAPEERREAHDFLQWLAEDHFTLLGFCQHDLVSEGGIDALRRVADSGLGLLREMAGEATSASFAALPQSARALARAPSPVLIVTKSNSRSTVHRRGFTDYIGVKRFDGNGNVVGEHRFLGLYTSVAYSARVSEVPLLRGKVAAVAARAGYSPGGHSAKALLHILQTYPRDELFQMSIDEVAEVATGILQLGERQRLRAFLRRDRFDRFVSCLVFVPREIYSTELRVRFQQILIDAFAGTGAQFDVLLADTELARILFTIRTTPGQIPSFDRHTIEAKLAAAARRWDDDLRDALIEDSGEARGLQLFKRWAPAFPAGYRERVAARVAVADVRKCDLLTTAAPLTLSLYRPLFGAAAATPGAGQTLGFKIYHAAGQVVLSSSLPMLEHMGVRVLGEHNDRIAAAEATIHLHDFEMQAPVAEEVEPETLARLFEEAFARVFTGAVENDDFNRLVLRAGLAADEIVILRAYAKYMRQIGFGLSQSFIEQTLANHARIARLLVQLFKLRFDPARVRGVDVKNDEAAHAQANAIEQALEKVSNLSEDRVLRQYLALIQATLRTNFWRTGVGHSGTPIAGGGKRRHFVSFKLDCARVPGLPEPKPLYEIFVYSPRFEGIHLRGGRVARGGLRWSDRAEDFRTEVLGLVKAQMVKNTVIVPVGSKGGFVLKKAPPAGPAPADREAFMKEGVACYQDYLRGLLDLTDNLVGDQVVPPPQIVRHDGDDPYLVVAADKGTATFSDYANAVSAEYGHWLGDAFASGGSAGYDHKAMGITARGAWESVRRHFREMGVDTQTTMFTVVGIGDMSGDVFGNGMLLSREIRLLAAFDHRHIFLDPTPDPAAAFGERERMFKLPRSSWADYDARLISAGGGVWARSEKSVPISPQARAALAIEGDKLTPTELISALLKAPVDLLYNGGIGTYVKAASETHAEVGDRANDALRVNGRDLRCKVVAEGGNLGFTQRGRIEAALAGRGGAGVRLYTDAIDNSAGVDTSDHEVNIKILLGLAIAEGEMTEKQRNVLLAQMTDEVAALVLRDNYFQAQALAIAARMATRWLDQQVRFMRYLEKVGQLNRALEFLPADDEVAERKGRGTGLSAPELAVLLAYSKMWLFEELLGSDVPEDPWIGAALARYFPAALRERFASHIARHPLRREIIATHVLNSMVNRVGATFVHRLTEMTGARPPQIVRAYLLTREIFDYVALWQQIEALDNRVPDAVQSEMIISLGRLTTRATTWFVRSRRLNEPMQATFTRFAASVAALRAQLAPETAAQPQVAAWTAAGVPADLAQRAALTESLFSALDIGEIAEATGRSLADVGAVHAGVSLRLGLAQLRDKITGLPSDTYWQSLALAALGDDLSGLQRGLAQQVVALGAREPDALLVQWASENAVVLERTQRLLTELTEAKHADLAMLSVALRELRNLV